MAAVRFVAYYRVSTDSQGKSGLGLEAQRSAVLEYLNGGSWSLMAEFTEVESGRRKDRPELLKALERCRLTGATLVISKLDRLSRNATLLLNLQDAGVDFVALDMPSANRFVVGIMALVAEEEARAISERTKSALAAAKARGVRLGNPKGFGGKVYKGAGKAAQDRARAFAVDIGPTIQELGNKGLAANAMAQELQALGIRTARGGKWTAQAVLNIKALLHDGIGTRG